MEIEGRFFAARQSLSRPARLILRPEGLALAIEGEDQPRRPRLQRISERLGGLPRKLTFSDGSLFEAPADAPVDGLLTPPGSFTALRIRMEASWRLAAAAAVVTVALLLGAYRYGLPLAAHAAADMTPATISDLMNDGTLQAIDGNILGPSTLPPARIDEVTRLFEDLRAKAPGGTHLELLVRDGGRIGANAVALPGGTIIVTDQLIRLARSDDEIAGVLAHEIGHVESRHSLQQIYRALGIAALATLIGGDGGQLVNDAVNQAALLQSFAYSREFEVEADARSVAIMLAAGRDPVAFVDLLDRLTADAPGARETGYFSTHPGTSDRRDAVLRAAQALGWCQHCGDTP